MAYTYPQTQSYGMGMNASYDPQEEERKRLERQLQELSRGAPEQPTIAPVSPDQVMQPTMPQVSEPVQVVGPMQPPTQPMSNEQLQQAMSKDVTSQGNKPVDKLDQFANQGIKMPGMQMAVGTTPATDYINQYQNIQSDPGKLLQFSQDETIPEWMKNRARSRAADILDSERQKQMAKERMQNMNPNDLEKALREKTTGGSWLKAIMFGMLGMENSAQEEAAKLGIGKETSITGSNGTPYIVKLASNGTPIEGFNAKTGTKLTPTELVAVTAGAAAQKGAVTHTGKMQVIEGPQKGEVFYERTTPQGIELVDVNGNRYTGPTSNLRPFGIGSDIATKNQIQIQELQNKLAFAGPTASASEREKIIAESEARFGPLPEEYKAIVRGVSPQVQGTVPTQAQPVPQPMPTARPSVQGQPAPTMPVAPSPLPQAGPNVGGTNVTGATPAAREAALATQQKQQAANIEQKKELNVAELKPPAVAKGTNAAQDIKNQHFANETYGLIKPVSDLIKKSTGSGIGAGVDVVAGKFGVGTKGQQAIAELKPLIYPILANVPRFEGPQSDYDVQVYKQAAGDFANESLPVPTRLAALNGLVTLLKKYDKENKNDWTFGENLPSNTTSSGNKYKRVQ